MSFTFGFSLALPVELSFFGSFGTLCCCVLDSTRDPYLSIAYLFEATLPALFSSEARSGLVNGKKCQSRPVASLSPISVIRGKVNEERQTGSKNSKNEGPKKEAEMNT